MPTPERNDDLLYAALLGYELELATINRKIAELKRRIGARVQTRNGSEMVGVVAAPALRRKRSRISPEGRARIAAAQRKRWAAAKKKAMAAG
jgi:hypothetical protein